jgi:hypothetical protein
MKIAVLVLAHHNRSQLNQLVSHLAQDFNVFVHLDRKSKLQVRDVIQHGRVTVIKEYRVYWGSFNQIRAILTLLRSAYLEGYDRYILISGQDIPIVSNQDITQFFRGNHHEYMECEQLPRAAWHHGGLDRLTKYHANATKGVKGLEKYYLYLANLGMKIFNRLMRYERGMEIPFYGGANWFNLSDVCVTEIFRYLNRHPEYLERYKHTRCADEIFFQTLIMNLGMGDRLIDSSLRYMDWRSGPEYPKTLRMQDYEPMTRSDMLFARKIDPQVDGQLIDALYSQLAQPRYAQAA